MEAIGFIRDLNTAVRIGPSMPVRATGVTIRAYFRDLEDHLIEHIRGADAVVGCVAWLTSRRILDSLASVKHGVSIIVQKEEFLRPDLGADEGGDWKEQLRQQYDALQSLDCWPDSLDIVTKALIDGSKIEPVRCAGIHRKGLSAQPRMHHKFIVFCKRPLRTSGLHAVCRKWPEPYAVWTGSFNFTRNGGNSLENAVYIHDSKLSDAFYREWEQIAWISEPLDWHSHWVDQEWSVT